jgi:hypothetical protein
MSAAAAGPTFRHIPMIEIAAPKGARVPFCTHLVRIERAASLVALDRACRNLSEASMSDVTFESAPAAAANRRPAAPARKRLIARLWQNAERQVEEIEDRLSGAEGAALEQSAKALAVLTRAVRDLVAIDQDMRPEGARKAGGQDAAIEAPARAYADFRNELAQRLESLLGEQQGAAVSGDASAENA